MQSNNDRWRSWWTAAGLLLATLIVAEFTGIDLWVQDWFFNFETGTWWMDRRAPVPRALFYTGPKILIIGLAVALLVITLGPAGWRKAWGGSRRPLAAVLLMLTLLPSFIGFLKGATNVYCPWDVQRYGGEVPYVRVFEKHPSENLPDHRGGGWPAGHASGGFALVGLMALTTDRRWQRRFVAIALLMGWAMGLYQVAKGAHYLSHTLVTMSLAWVFFVPLEHWVAPLARRHSAVGAMTPGQNNHAAITPT